MVKARLTDASEVSCGSPRPILLILAQLPYKLCENSALLHVIFVLTILFCSLIWLVFMEYSNDSYREIRRSRNMQHSFKPLLVRNLLTSY